MALAKPERDSIIEHATQIMQLIRDPSSFLTELHIQQQQYYSIRWLVHFNVLDQILLPPSHVSYRTVATTVKVPESSLRSVARMAMTSGFLRETPSGDICHSALSAAFSQDAHLRTQLKHIFNATTPIMAAFVEATERWGDTSAPNETAYNIANDTDLPFFAHLKARPELQARFADYMKSRAVSHTGSNVEYLLEAFDWEALGDAKVVDVGGSSGATAIMLAQRHPKLQLVVQDLPGPIESAKDCLAELPIDVRSRIQAFEHDFFQPQPEKGSDIYLLRTILHDWPETDAVAIVKRVVDAMAPSSRLLIMDMVLPKPGSGSLSHEATLRQKDLMMMGTFNSKEREVEEWSDLLAKADPRLRIRAIQRPPGSELSVIEAYLNENSIQTDGSGANGIGVTGTDDGNGQVDGKRIHSVDFPCNGSNTNGGHAS